MIIGAAAGDDRDLVPPFGQTHSNFRQVLAGSHDIREEGLVEEEEP